MKTARIFGLTVVLFLLLAGTALAVDLTNRIGVGFNNQLSYGIIGSDSKMLTNAYLTNQGISVKYWATRDIAIEGVLGFLYSDFQNTGGWGLTLGGKFIYNLVYEKQMNLYTGGGLAILPVHTDNGHDSHTKTGFSFMGFVGAEFFFRDFPNIGFDLEFGLQYLDFDEYRQFGTFGGGFTTFGIRYYF
jgi:hypothetical protein